jgi:hypothetical protein
MSDSPEAPEPESRTVRTLVQSLIGPGEHARDTEVVVLVDGALYNIRSLGYDHVHELAILYAKPRAVR